MTTFNVVCRPFKTHDFMTGMAAVPGKDLPLEVVSKMVSHFIFSQLAHNGYIVFLYSFSLSILFSPFFVLLYYIYSYLSVFLFSFSLNFHFIIFSTLFLGFSF